MTSTAAPARDVPADDRSTTTPTLLALGGWITLVAVSAGITAVLRASGVPTWIGAPPLFGRFRFGLDEFFLVALVVGVAMIGVAPRVVAILRWRTLLVVVPLAAVVFALALALVGDGPDGITRPVTKPSEYLPQLGVVGDDPLGFLAGFVDHIDARRLRVHAAGHPPGPLLFLWGLDRVGLATPTGVALTFVIGGALAIPAVLLAVRDTVSEAVARSAAPFLVVVPAAIWIASSADALFAGIGAWAAALVVLATGRRDQWGDVLALVGGLLFGVALLMSYGLVLLALVPFVVACARRRARPIVLASVGGLAVLGAAAAAGFWLLDGLAATHERYADGISNGRPYFAFLVANLGALALVVGPAVAVGLARLGRSRTWLLVGGALGAIALANVSGLSKAETERIWLPFAIWLLPAAWVLARDRVHLRTWLGAQLATALTIQVVVRTGW